MSSVGVAALSTTLSVFGSEVSVKRKTPGCVHPLRPSAADPPPETFVHELAATATASSASLPQSLKVTLTLLPHRHRRASYSGRCRGPCKTRHRPQARSPKV